MAVNLQAQLSALHDCLEQEAQIGPQNAHDIIGNLSLMYLQDVSDKDIDFVCSMLFHKDSGVVTFLRKTVSRDEFQATKAGLLEVLCAFITNHQRRVTPYATDIKDACLSLLTRDRHSKVKLAAVPLLIELVQQTSGSSVASDFNVPQMVEKVFLELTKPASFHSATVKAQIYHLLGVFAETFPTEMVAYSDRLLNVYVRTLKAEMTSKTKKPELSVIAGCLQGLSCLLVHFTQSAQEGTTEAYDIFKFARRALDTTIKHSRFEMLKSALALLSRHAPQFSEYLLDDHEAMYETFSHWSRVSNRDVCLAATAAMEAFLQQISSALVTQAAQGSRDAAAFKFFVKEFRRIMDCPQSNSREISLAIKGYGFFAAPCKIFLSVGDVKFMFNEMMQRSEQVFFGQAEVTDDTVFNLPSFLEALASILTQLDEISETFLQSLERLVVMQMENFPKLSQKVHFRCFHAVLKVLCALAPQGAVFRGFVNRVVYQGLIRTCSHPVVTTINGDNKGGLDGDKDYSPEGATLHISYRDYFALWKYLLESTKVKRLTHEGVELKVRLALTEVIYDELIHSILTMVRRLDLTATKAPAANMGDMGEGDSSTLFAVSSDPMQGLEAARPKDFVIFVNLVDFCREFLPDNQVQLFTRWVLTFGTEMIVHSTRLPLVSGFYKLLAVCMKICSRTQYFSPPQAKDEDSQDIGPVETVDKTQRDTCFLLFTKFSKEVLTRLSQYKEDLLASCLCLILSLPREVVLAEVGAVVPALQTALQLGHSYLPLAGAALDALEDWAHSLPPHILQPFYPTLLPCLDVFLKSTGASATETESVTLTSKKPGRKTGRCKIPVKLLKQQKPDDSHKASECQLEHIKLRCVRLLGSLGGATSSVLVSGASEGHRAVAWDIEDHLHFHVPFVDIKPTISLDPFLPRVVELALTSSERQTKVAACELFHALVLYTLGRGSQQPGAHTTLSQMEPLYRKIFPVVMQLSCDVEQVAKQLFEPLMMQMIHWFTGSHKFESEDTMALLDTLMDGVVCATDTALRDFSATCLKEFLKWSVKQASQKQQERSPFNVKSLLKRVYSLARHPSATKRLGAALTFNNIYVVFREEKSLVDVFTIEILVVFVESLAHAHVDDKSLGTQEQCKLALGHIQRIIQVKAELFNKKNKLRRTPKAWQDVTLTSVIEWLLRQCGRPETECRHTCMELVTSLVTCLPGTKTAKDFFRAKETSKKDVNYFVDRFEGGVYVLSGEDSGLKTNQTMAQLAGAFSVKTTLNWFDLVLASLDCYTWVIGQGLVSAATVLANEKSVIFEVLNHFFEKLAQGDISDAARLFTDQVETEVFTPRERDDYNRAKCTVIVRAMNFICVLLQPTPDKVILKDKMTDFWSENLWETVTKCVLQPLDVGFNMADVEVIGQLPNETLAVLRALQRHLPDNAAAHFKKHLAGSLTHKSHDLLHQLREHESSGVNVQHLVSGYGQVHRAGLLEEVLGTAGQTVPGLAEQLLHIVFKDVSTTTDGKTTASTLSPVSQRLAENLLELAFLLEVKAETLLQLFLDKTPISGSGSHISHQGSLFYAYFASVINRHLVAVVGDFVPTLVEFAVREPGIVGSVLCGILEDVATDRELRKKEGASVVQSVLRAWGHLRSWWRGETASQDTKALTLVVLTKIITIDSKVTCDATQPVFKDVFDCYTSMLTDSSTSLSHKSKVLDLIAFFTNVPAAEQKLLKKHLDRFVADNFPSRSSEYEVGSPRHSEYICALNKILTGLELSGSLVLLDVIICVLCTESQHVYEDKIQASLTRFIKCLPKERQKPALDVPFAIFTSAERYTADQRRAALERVCLSMLRMVHSSAVVEFFCEHITEVMSVIQTQHPRSQAQQMSQSLLVSRLGSFQLMEMLYGRLSKNEVSSKESKVNQVFCQGHVEKGNELTTAVTKAAHQVKSEDTNGETVTSDLGRQLRCAAYNALVAIISCTQTDEKFYRAFLFTEKPQQGQFLLDNLVDPRHTYKFDIELDTPMARKRKFVSIRREARDHGGTEEGDSDASVTYLASQYLADSSLSVDVSRFDFNASLQASTFSGSMEADSVTSRSRPSSASVQEPSVAVKEDFVEMDMDELNQHECMATLTALVQHLTSTVSPPLDTGVTPVAMPTWMKCLHEKLTERRTSVNVKLFISRLIINTEEVFQPYARFWLLPLIDVIVAETAGTDLNYFIVDLVVTLLSWHGVAIPEASDAGCKAANSLLEFLMCRCHHDTRQVLRNNLEMLKTMVEVWHDRVTPPTRVIYDNFSEQSVKSKRNLTGIQLAGLMLANKINPFCPATSGEIDKDRFYRQLAMNMTNESKQVYAPTAEVVGMTMALMSTLETGASERDWLEEFTDNVTKMLQTMKPDKFINCVWNMHRHHAVVADRFVSRVLFILPQVYGEFKTSCLEIILSRIEHINNAFQELKSKGLIASLRHRNESTQLVSLRLVQGMLRQLKPADLLVVLSSVTALIGHPNATCRAIMYDIIMWVYDNYRTEETAEGLEIMTSVKDTLLQGLSEDNVNNRLTMLNFWSDETRLPSGTFERLTAMLEAMYSPVTETQYLSYASNLLLEMTSKSPDFNSDIFDYPLSECKFQDYPVQSSWRRRHAAMTPHFVATQVSQTLSAVSQDISMETGHVRATQDLQQFTPTQDVGVARGPYNWLTQSSLDTFADPPTSVSQSQSSLLFTLGKKPAPARARRQHKAVGPGFGQDRLGGGGRDGVDSKQDSAEASVILRLRRRFVRDKESTQVHFARHQARLNKQRQELERERKQQRENQVTMYRRYRIGDLPDIQIKHSAIIAPLQALAQKDSSVARLLFSSIFKAIFAKIEIEKTETEAEEITEKLKLSLNNMLDQSTQYFPPFIGCVLDIANGSPVKLELDASVMNTSCLTSLQQPLGVLLLEDSLIQTEGADAAPSRKRRAGPTGSAVSHETTNWIELARLYKSLGDYDVLRGIFSSKFGTQELTKRALEAEMRGDYQTAAKLYTQGLSTEDWGDKKPPEVELDLWDDARLQCYDHLTQWGHLESASTASWATDSVDLLKIWDDTYYEEHYLPFMLRAKLKQLLDGDASQDALLQFVDESMKVPERKALLESRHSEEVALLYVWQEDYDRARFYADNATQTFLQEWGSIDPLMTSSRAARLQVLQKVTELQEFLAFMKTDRNLESVTAATDLINTWHRRQPDTMLDPTALWDDVITNRCVYIDHITSRLESSGKLMDTGQNLFDREKVLLRLSQADAARGQGNIPVALKQLKNTWPTVKGLKDLDLQLTWTHTYARTHLRRCHISEMTPMEKFTALAGTWDHLVKHGGDLTTGQGQSVQHTLLLGETVHSLINVLDLDLDPATHQKVADIAGSSHVSRDEIRASLLEKGYQHLKAAVSMAMNQSESETRREGVNSAHMALVKYCDEHLRAAEDGAVSTECKSFSSFPVAMVISLLGAMRNNDMEAKQRFPRLLQIVASYPDSLEIFRRKAGEVPCWMFIAWISQMTALLDKSESPAVHDILLTLAREYPEAIVYPYKLSSEGYSFNSTAVGKKSRTLKLQLDDLLSRNKLVELFVRSLEQFGQPNMVFRDWFTDCELTKLMEAPAKNAARIRQLTRDMYCDLAVVVTRSQQSLYGDEDDSLPSSLVTGDYRRKFAKKFVADLEKLFGRDGNKLLSMTAKTFMEKAKNLCQQMAEYMKSKALVAPGTMKEYSPWMADFQGREHQQQLEIPGQYSGATKPLPEYHAKIASFDDRVLVLTSLRQPKRITVRGSDEKDHMFLVKCGEDLRLDHRLETLFAVMNQVYALDPACRQRKLQLRTYKVIPMTTRLGLIEWMRRTMTLKEFLLRTMTDSENEFYNSNKGPRAAFQRWLPPSPAKGRSGQQYRDLYKKYSWSDTMTAFRSRENLVPWDLLRRGYLRLSAGPEAYFTLKCNGATSHALLCMSHYIAGIGDRHLSNFMIDLDTGNMVGIDFGHAFGSATQFLEVPELMPFRLTRQIRNLCHPLGEAGLTEGTMIHALHALRSNHDLLICTMDIFIKEPSLDWKQNAMKQMQKQTEPDKSLSDQAWYPKQKVAYATRKLEGHNPAFITRDELKLGHSRSKAFEHFVCVAMGDPKHDIRAQLGPSGLTVDQQVACLLNQATDPNLLGRVWMGWESWM